MKKLPENIILRKFKSEYFLLDSLNERLHSFNETGNLIFEMWLEGYSKENIAGKLSEEYEIEKEKALDDIKSFLSDLSERKII